MRELKFRAKTLKDPRWAFGCYLWDDKWVEAYIYESKLSGAFYILHGVKVNVETVGQYIGTQDRTKCDIYEGDICKVTGLIESFDEEATDYLGEVEYSNASARFMISLPSLKTCYWFEQGTSNVSVIGNKFDNPELLELMDD